MLVCLDTQIMIWGIKEQATQGQTDMIPRAKRFLVDLDQKGTKVIIPAIIVGELLLRVPPELHLMVLNLFQKGFIVVPFDLQAAAHFARIWQANNDAAVIQELSQEDKLTNRQIKADCMIVATAVAKGVDCIYSHDKGLRKFAKGHIEVKEMPDIPLQMDLFPT